MIALLILLAVVAPITVYVCRRVHHRWMFLILGTLPGGCGTCAAGTKETLPLGSLEYCMPNSPADVLRQSTGFVIGFGLTVAVAAFVVHGSPVQSRWAQDPDLAPFCPMCGYSLRGGVGMRCPECGTLLEPN